MNFSNSNNWSGTSVLLTTFCVVLATLCHIDRSFSQEQAASIEPAFLSNVRQLTFEGLRAGEGYFNSDGTLMTFQSERRTDNPFFQIYLVDLQTGDVEPISPGHGKTTCSWIHPNNNLVMFSSTHGDPEARAKQKAEIEFRESGKSRRYAWDYDPTFEIYAFDRKQKTYNQLTDSPGYDAEGSYSPDGKLIAFASNRAGYDQNEPLTDEQRKKFEIDPSCMMDIYLMNADGSNVRRLTKSPGYDGGPFFSHDGQKICWRRFSEDGKTAEIFTMNLDGSNELQLTRMGALSWAPYFHPSGKYLIFNTNVHGFANFELYLVAADGKSLPVRVTDTDGFDGLASFTPDGNKLTWTSGRTAKKDSQIFLADWNHEAALQALLKSGIQTPKDISPKTDAAGNRSSNPTSSESHVSKKPQAPNTYVYLDSDAFRAGQQAAKETKPGFDSADVKRHVEYLGNSAETGKMSSYVAGYLTQLGLTPAKNADSMMQPFEFPAEVRFSPTNQLAETFTGEEEAILQPGLDWNPLPTCGNLDSANRPVVFAGFGIVAPEQNGQAAYDSYAALKVDVKDKWVLVFNSAPAKVEPARQAFLQFHGSLQNKMEYARERGALGLIVIDNASAKLGEGPLRGQFVNFNLSLGAIAVNEQVAEGWLSTAPESIVKLKDQLNQGEALDPFEIPDLKLAAKIETQSTMAQDHSVIGRLGAPDGSAASAIMICAAMEELGTRVSNSAKPSVTPASSDAVSGIACLLEIAEFMSAQQKDGKLALKQDLVFAVWSSPMRGLHGSSHYAKSLTQPASANSRFVIKMDGNGAIVSNDQPTNIESLEPTFEYLSKNHPGYSVVVQTQGEPQPAHTEPLRQLAQKYGITNIRFSDEAKTESSRPLNAVIHLDHIGRLDAKLIIHGTGSSPYWPSAIESRNVVAGLPLATFGDLQFVSDASSFQAAGVPAISAFTGTHAEMGKSEDTPDKINAQGVASISQLMALIARGLAVTDEQLAFVAPEPKIKRAARAGGGASLGTIPAYGEDVVGVKISDVRPGTPAQKAGLKPNDIIVKLAGRELEDVQAYSDLLGELPIGKETEVVVERDGKQLTFKITPIARQR